MSNKLIVVDLNSNLDDYIALISILSYSLNDNVNIISINHTSEKENILDRLVHLSKNNNVTVYRSFDYSYKSNVKPNKTPIKKRYYILKTLSESAFNSNQIYLFAPISYIKDYVELINKKRISVLYFSPYFLQTKDKPISTISIIKDEEFLDELDIISNVRKILIFPKNISKELYWDKDRLIKTANKLSEECNSLYSLLLFINKDILNKDHLFSKLSAPIFMYLSDSIDIVSYKVKAKNNILIEDDKGIDLKIANHIHKIEDITPFIIEMFYEKTVKQSHSINISIKNRYQIVRVINTNFHDLYCDEYGWEKKLPLSEYSSSIGRSSYLIHFVTLGNVVFYYNSKKYKLSAGDAFLIEPNKRYYYQADEDYPCHYCWISFGGNLAKEIISNSEFYNKKELKPVVKFNDFNAITTNINELFKLDNELPNYPHILLGKLYLILSKLYNKEITNSDDDIVEETIKYIEDNYALNIKVNDICSILNCDRSTLFRNFKKVKGISVNQYLLSYRIDKAKYLLKNTDLSVAKIGQKSGFDSLSKFISNFKKVEKKTPKEFRLTNLNKIN